MESEFIRADEFCNKVFDGTHDTPKPNNNGKLLITSKNILGSNLDFKDAYYISNDDYNQIQKRSKISQWDILFSMIGSVGEIYLEKNSSIPYAIKNIGVFSTNEELKSKWLYYYLKSPYARKFINNYLNGAVQKFLPLYMLREFPVLKLNANSESIVKILSTIDNKIELNNKINKELEEMAKTLYNFWFVQFDFPDENNKPYKSSGSEMVYNEELKREIPKGWEVKKLNSLFEFQKGVEPGSSEYSEYKKNNNYIKFFRVGDIYSDSNLFIDVTKNNYLVVENRDVIVTFDGSVGKVGFGIDGVISGGLRKIFDKNNLYDNSLVYFIFKDERIIATIHQYSQGSILLHGSSSINELKIPFEKDFYLKFQKVVKPIYEQMVKKKIENKELTEIRDFLLPLLMNGQVKVK